jgi:hypothetical protein
MELLLIIINYYSIKQKPGKRKNPRQDTVRYIQDSESEFNESTQVDKLACRTIFRTQEWGLTHARAGVYIYIYIYIYISRSGSSEHAPCMLCVSVMVGVWVSRD